MGTVTTTRWSLPAPDGSDQIPNGDNQIRALASAIDALLTPFSSGVLASRPTSTSGSPGILGRVYDPTDAWGEDRDQGTSWQRMAPLPAIVTSLPGSPVDGQEVYFQTSAMATLGVRWHLAYNAASASAYKWEHVGGSPLENHAAGSVSFNNPGGGGAGDLTLTPPLAGDYMFRWGASVNNNSGGDTHQFLVQAVSAIRSSGESFTQGGGTLPLGHEERLNGLTAGQGVSTNYTVSSGILSVSNRFLVMQPVRVG
jgi:hypothetical protein